MVEDDYDVPRDFDCEKIVRYPEETQLPKEAVCLARAYSEVLIASPKIYEIETAVEQAEFEMSDEQLKKILSSNDGFGTELYVPTSDAYKIACAIYINAQLDANRIIRGAISARKITPYTYIASTKTFNKLPAEGWLLSEGHAATAIFHSYVSPFDASNPGPQTNLNGVDLPVFFFRDDFSRWLAKCFPDPKARRGRPEGSGGKDDDVHLNSMLELIGAGKAETIWGAALHVAKDIGGQSDMSTAKRLLRKYKRRKW